MRSPLVIGNWKLNGSKPLVAALLGELQSSLAPYHHQCDVAVAPPCLYLDQAAALLDQGGGIALAAQNVDHHEEGAFTGEISVGMLQEFQVTYVIIGHSERRTYHQESNARVAEKFSCVKRAGLTPVLCLGETAAQRAEGATQAVCTAQLEAILQYAGISAFQGCVIAYEPLWAIGSGQSATPAQAQAVHQFIRDSIAQQDICVADSVRLLYGGSVTAHNARALYTMPDIDGLLVGGAALQAASFTEIIASVTPS
jgi:triosephosphate isomerase (TIM)